MEPTPVKTRIESIDAFRGITILVMVFVIAVAAAGYKPLPQTMRWMDSLSISTWNHAEVGYEYFQEEKAKEGLTEAQIAALPEHALKNVGCTVTDLVAPFFVFIVGLCIPLSKGKRGREWFRHVLSRSVLLIAAGVLYISLILGLSWWWGILQAIGVSYFMGALSMKLPFRQRVALVFGILGFHMLMSESACFWLHFGESAAPFLTVAEPGGSVWKPLIVHCRPWVSISYGAMTIMGTLLGEAVATKDRAAITRRALAAGAAFTLIGWLIHKAGLITGQTSLCLNKPDVTASYALFTSGLASFFFLGLYYVIDVWGWKKWAAVFNVFGANALLAYFMQILMRIGFRALKLEDFFKVPPNDTLTKWTGLFPSLSGFLLDKTGYNGMLWGLIWTFCLWSIILYCNKKEIYWKL